MICSKNFVVFHWFTHILTQAQVPIYFSPTPALILDTSLLKEISQGGKFIESEVFESVSKFLLTVATIHPTH